MAYLSLLWQFRRPKTQKCRFTFAKSNFSFNFAHGYERTSEKKSHGMVTFVGVRDHLGVHLTASPSVCCLTDSRVYGLCRACASCPPAERHGRLSRLSALSVVPSSFPPRLVSFIHLNHSVGKGLLCDVRPDGVSTSRRPDAISCPTVALKHIRLSHFVCFRPTTV